MACIILNINTRVYMSVRAHTYILCRGGGSYCWLGVVLRKRSRTTRTQTITHKHLHHNSLPFYISGKGHRRCNYTFHICIDAFMH